MDTMLTPERASQVQTPVEHAAPSESVRAAQSFFLSELPGFAFAVITLVWIVSSLYGLKW